MEKTTLILLVGEQPAPNLLPTRHLKPDMALLVYTDRTEAIANRLGNLLSGCQHLKVDPYDLSRIQDVLQDFLEQKFSGYRLLFNLTGGTKPMSLAAFLVAYKHQAPFMYFQTEGSHSLLYHYQFTGPGIVHLDRQEEISETIKLDDYLRLQIGNYTKGPPRNAFEQQVYETLQDISGLEVLSSVRPQGLEALEVDLVIRLGNQVGVIEVKTRGAKSGIDQIQAVAEQRYLGTYVAKFLVSGESVDLNNKNLAKAYNIEVIELTSYTAANTLSAEDRQILTKRIRARLGGRP